MVTIIGVSTGSPAYGFRPRAHAHLVVSLCSFFFFLFLSLSLSLSLIFSTVHIVKQRTLLTEKERHESPRVTRRGREKLTQLQKSLAGGTGLDYQRRSCGRHGGACLSFQKFETRSTR